MINIYIRCKRICTFFFQYLSVK